MKQIIFATLLLAFGHSAFAYDQELGAAVTECAGANGYHVNVYQVGQGQLIKLFQVHPYNQTFIIHAEAVHARQAKGPSIPVWDGPSMSLFVNGTESQLQYTDEHGTIFPYPQFSCLDSRFHN